MLYCTSVYVCGLLEQLRTCKDHLINTACLVSHGAGPSCLSDPMATTTLHACLAHPPQVLMDLSRNARLLARDSLNGPEVMASSADGRLDGPCATCSVNLHFIRPVSMGASSIQLSRQ